MSAMISFTVQTHRESRPDGHRAFCIGQNRKHSRNLRTEGPMGARSKGNPPRKRGPKPDTLVLPGKWEKNVGNALKTPPPKGGSPKPPNKKGRGGR